jgi:hypothetical protein
VNLEVGQWIEWQTDTSVKRGEVIEVQDPSFVVRWLGGEEQVFPVIEYVLSSSRLEIIRKPKEAARIERDRRKGVMSIQRAAASLGTTPKRIRAQLRDGKLKGVRQDGRWIAVELEG